MIIADRLTWIYPPILFVIGIIGNVLFLMVLVRPNIRRTSISLLLICLAICDTAVLTFSVLKRWIGKFLETDFRNSSLAYCKIDTFLTYFLLQLSPWILVLITVERTYSVIYPHKVNDKFTKKRLLGALVLTILILGAINSHIFFSISLQQSGSVVSCGVPDMHLHFFFKIWPWIDMCLMFFIPVCFMIIGNVVIIIKLRSSQRFRVSSFSERPLSDGESTTTRMGQHVSSFTKTTVLLNTSFILLELPSVIFGIGQPYWFPVEAKTEASTAQLKLLSTCVYMAMYTYNAINFLLYMFCGSKLRNEFLRMVRLRKNHSYNTGSNSSTKLATKLRELSVKSASLNSD